MLGRHYRTVRGVLRWTMLFLVSWAFFTVSAYRNNENLGLVRVKCETRLLGLDLATALDLKTYSPWNSTTEMRCVGDNIWRIDQAVSRVIKEIRVLTNRDVPMQDLRWSISCNLSAEPLWTPADVREQQGAVTLTFPDSRAPKSIIPGRQNTLNWLGDCRLLRGSGFKAFIVVLVVSILLRLLRTSRDCWFIRTKSDRLLHEPKKSAGLGASTFKPLILWGIVAFLFSFCILGMWRMTITLWPGLHWDGVAYSTTIINHAAGAPNTFDVYTTALLRSPHSNVCDAHGQVYQATVGTLISKPSYVALLRSLHWANLSAFVLAFVVFSIFTYRVLKTSWLKAAFVALPTAAATSSVLLYLSVTGRPPAYTGRAGGV